LKPLSNSVILFLWLGFNNLAVKWLDHNEVFKIIYSMYGIVLSYVVDTTIKDSIIVRTSNKRKR